MARNDAFVTPALLTWARERAGFDVDRAAEKLQVAAERLASWEAGTALPTVRQAKTLAKAFGQPFAALYLPSPPAEDVHLPKDYRRHAGTTLVDGVSVAIRLDVARAWERRAIALELLEARGDRPPAFDISLELSASVESAGNALRERLGIPDAEQRSWRDTRVAFNSWRESIESLGVLVLQTKDLDPHDVRAYSLFATILPVIVVNRKDVYPARTFSLVHELVHLALRTEGLCDLSTNVEREPERQRLEVFCNAVAAACLMPQSAMLSHRIVDLHQDNSPVWSDLEIDGLARDYAVSREAILRRLLTFGLTTESFYERMRTRYQQEYAARPEVKGFVTPPTNALSLLGKPFVRLVLENFDSGNITSSDASDYLGVRLKHLPALSAAVESE